MRALSPSLCDLRKRSLVQAAHIAPESIAAVVNGLALCAIHHLAFARNALGIDSDGVVHIAKRLLEETDGPMLRTGLRDSTARQSDCLASPKTGRNARLDARFTRLIQSAA